MKSKTLFKAIGNIDGNFIEEDEVITLASHMQKNRRSRFYKKPLLVAAVLTILISMTVTALAAAGIINITYFFDPESEPEFVYEYIGDDGTILRFIDPESYPIYTITHAESGLSLQMRVSTWLLTSTDHTDWPGYQIGLSAELQPHFLPKEEILYIASNAILDRHGFDIDGLSGSMTLIDKSIHDPNSFHWVVRVYFNEETPDIERDELFFVEIDAVTGNIGDYFRHTPSSPAFVG
jgi:hypothetical protein